MAGKFDAARLARARSAISLGAAFALFFTVLLGYDAPASRAAGGVIDALFGTPQPPVPLYIEYVGPAPRAVPRLDRPHRARLAKHMRARNVQARRQLLERHKFARARRALIALAARRPAPAETAPRPKVEARHAVCGRACDRDAFPASPVSGVPDNAAREARCETLCRDDIGRAASAKIGMTYADLPKRLNGGDEKTKACFCRTADVPAETALLTDATLRPGDTVVTPSGLRVLRRGSRYPFKSDDFLSLAETDAPLSHKSALYAIERALATPQGRASPPDGAPRRSGG